MEIYMNLGGNLEITRRADDTIVMQARSDTGSGVMTLAELLPGIQIIYNDFHMKEIKSEYVRKTDLFCVDHCREGRLEQETAPGIFRYIEAGDLKIDIRNNHNTDFYFPLSHYHGITVGFEPQAADQSIRKIFPDFPVAVNALKQKYCTREDCFFIREKAQINHIFSELYHVPQNIRRHYAIIKVLELLLYLGGLETENGKTRKPYFYKSQTEKIKAIQTLITTNLKKSYTLEELSKRFDIPSTSMKNCFKAVYGKPVYSYLRSYRMNQAATLLASRKLSIAEVAGEVGYDNPSKFSAAFRAEMHSSPLEYRNALTAALVCKKQSE